MRRREVVAGLTFIAAWSGAHAQQPGRRYQVGILSPEAPPPGMLEVLERGLHEVGYVRGQNIVCETRNAGEIARASQPLPASWSVSGWTSSWP